MPTRRRRRNSRRPAPPRRGELFRVARGARAFLPRAWSVCAPICRRSKNDLSDLQAETEVHQARLHAQHTRCSSRPGSRPPKAAAESEKAFEGAAGGTNGAGGPCAGDLDGLFKAAPGARTRKARRGKKDRQNVKSASGFVKKSSRHSAIRTFRTFWHRSKRPRHSGADLSARARTGARRRPAPCAKRLRKNTQDDRRGDPKAA